MLSITDCSTLRPCMQEPDDVRPWPLNNQAFIRPPQAGPQQNALSEQNDQTALADWIPHPLYLIKV